MAARRQGGMGDGGQGAGAGSAGRAVIRRGGARCRAFRPGTPRTTSSACGRSCIAGSARTGARRARRCRRRRSARSSTGTRTWSMRCRPGRPIATRDTSRGCKTDDDWMGEGAGHRGQLSPGGDDARLRQLRRSARLPDRASTRRAPKRRRSSPDNFTGCFDASFPSTRRWSRRSGGAPSSARSCRRTTPAEALARRWDAGPIGRPATAERRSGADRIHTVRLANGNVFRLAGLHIMTKELRKWLWMTMWWSPDADGDFGADRPADLDRRSVWRHYKMCVVSAHDERDPSQPPGPTWCSNPYLERGAGNARTNCIGCHQHGGTVAQAREIIGDETRFPRTGAPRCAPTFRPTTLWALDARGQPRARRRRRGRLLRLVREVRRHHEPRHRLLRARASRSGFGAGCCRSAAPSGRRQRRAGGREDRGDNPYGLVVTYAEDDGRVRVASASRSATASSCTCGCGAGTSGTLDCADVVAATSADRHVERRRRADASTDPQFLQPFYGPEWQAEQPTAQMIAEARAGADRIIDTCSSVDAATAQISAAVETDFDVAWDAGLAASANARCRRHGGIARTSTPPSSRSTRVQKYAEACVAELGEIPFFQKTGDGEYTTYSCMDSTPIPMTVTAADGTVDHAGRAGRSVRQAAVHLLAVRAGAARRRRAPTTRARTGCCCAASRSAASRRRKFNDMAMIGHNPLTGKTCFFQNALYDKTDGAHVPHPADKVKSETLWSGVHGGARLGHRVRALPRQRSVHPQPVDRRRARPRTASRSCRRWASIPTSRSATTTRRTRSSTCTGRAGRWRSRWSAPRRRRAPSAIASARAAGSIGCRGSTAPTSRSAT